jgi:hypothetical protein
MKMSLAFKSNDPQEYATRTEIHYMFHVPYAAIARSIREGKLEMRLVDGKIQIHIAEAAVIFGKNNPDLFA